MIARLPTKVLVQGSPQLLASVRTTARSRPPIYFFGDSLGLLGFGAGRQRETIEASLVFEEEEEEERGIFEEGGEGSRFEKAKYPFEDLKTKVFDEEHSKSTEQIPSENGKEMKGVCCTSPQVPSSPISSTSPPTSVQGPTPPPTTTAPPPTTTIAPSSPSSKIDNPPPTTNLVDSGKNFSSPAEDGGGLTREEIIKLFTSRNPPEQKSS